MINEYTKTDIAVSKFVNALKLKEFDPKKQLIDVKNFFILILAPRRSGKSILMKDMLSKIHKWYDEAYLFSETSATQPDMYEYVPKDNRFNSFDIDKIEELYNQQYNYILECMANGIDKSKCKYKLFIFDDIISDKAVRNSGILDRLAVEGRHVNVAVLVLSQEVGGKYGINKVCRSNSDVIICFFLNSIKDRELITTQFLSMNSKKEADPIFKKGTIVEYQALVMCNFINTRDYEKKLFTYNAKLKVPKFIIGKYGLQFNSEPFENMIPEIPKSNKKKLHIINGE